MNRPTVLFYCQHSLGLGHLVRSFALAGALAERFRVVLLNGGRLPRGLPVPPGVEVVSMPPLGMTVDGTLVSHDRRRSTDRALQLRRRQMLALHEELRPEVLFVELFPFGRKKFAGELVPLLEAARDAGTLTVCSLRDILVASRHDQQKFDERASLTANALFDAILVHADPRFARLEETFRPKSPLSVPVHYTGFVTGRNDERAPERGDHVVISAGGGRVGRSLLEEAIQRLNGTPMRAIAGPLMPQEDFDALKRRIPRNVELIRSVPDLSRELRHAAASISQCGYNTALDLVRTRVPALVVPYATPEEDEQTRRARRLEALDLVRVAEHVDAKLLDFQPAPARLDLDGAVATRDLLYELIA